MAKFTLRENDVGNESLLAFYPEMHSTNEFYANSAELQFTPTNSANKVWSQFASELLDVLRPRRVVGNYGFTETGIESQWRQYVIVLQGTEMLSRENLVRNTPVKCRILSTMRIRPGVSRGSSFLDRLTEIVTPTNVKFVIGSGSDLRLPFPKENLDIEMKWDDAQKCWCTPDTVYFSIQTSRLFEEFKDLYVKLGILQLEINQNGLNEIFRFIYYGEGMHGNAWLRFKEMLENEEFADLEIICTGREQPVVFKAHRFVLAGAGDVMKAMLCDTRDYKWSEAEKKQVTFDYSAECVKALLNFVYYGGVDLLFCFAIDVIVELLELSHMYDLKKLTRMLSFLLLGGYTKPDFFTLSGAIKLFVFTKQMQGRPWNQMRRNAFLVVQNSSEQERISSIEYQKFAEHVNMMGAVYFRLLNESYSKEYEAVCMHCNIDQVQGITLDRVSKEDATYILEYFQFGVDYIMPRHIEVAIGIVLLMEYCDQQVTYGKTQIKAYFPEVFSDYKQPRIKHLDYLVELFQFCVERNGDFWNLLKQTLAFSILYWQENDVYSLQNSKKYLEMTNNSDLAGKLQNLQKRGSPLHSRKKIKFQIDSKQ